MKKFIGEIQLRNSRRIYSEGEIFIVEQTDKNGRITTEKIDVKIVNSLRRVLKGKTVSVKEAFETLSTIKGMILPYNHGYKLSYYAQDILIVLVALERASVEKVGRAYYYTIYDYK